MHIYSTSTLNIHVQECIFIQLQLWTYTFNTNIYSTSILNIHSQYLFNFNLEHSHSTQIFIQLQLWTYTFNTNIYSTSTMNIHIQHKYLFNFNLNTNIYSTSSSSISFRKLRRYIYSIGWIPSTIREFPDIRYVYLFNKSWWILCNDPPQSPFSLFSTKNNPKSQIRVVAVNSLSLSIYIYMER